MERLDGLHHVYMSESLKGLEQDGDDQICISEYHSGCGVQNGWRGQEWKQLTSGKTPVEI